MGMFLLHLLIWTIAGAVMFGYLGAIAQIAAIGMIASGFFFTALFLS